LTNCIITYILYPVFIAAFNAQMQPVDSDLITSVTFPEEGDTQIIIPADAIRYQRSVEGMYLPYAVQCLHPNYVLFFNKETFSLYL